MPLDPTISLEAGRGVTPNLLATVAQDPGQLRNLLTLQGQSVAGQAFQSSIGPDGMLDMAKFGNRLASDPRARLVAPQAFNTALEGARSQQEYATKQKAALMAMAVPMAL